MATAVGRHRWLSRRQRALFPDELVGRLVASVVEWPLFSSHIDRKLHRIVPNGGFHCLGERAIVPEPTRQFLAIGFFGAFTTFSSFTLDALSLQGEHGWWLALMSVLAHNALCLAAAYLGWRLVTVG